MWTHLGSTTLMKDWRRLNVSFTRAKSKLIIVGSYKTLLLTEIFSLTENQDCILRLMPGADLLHADAFLPKLYSSKHGAIDEEYGFDGSAVHKEEDAEDSLVRMP